MKWQFVTNLTYTLNILEENNAKYSKINYHYIRNSCYIFVMVIVLYNLQGGVRVYLANVLHNMTAYTGMFLNMHNGT
jgi:hypothetical protein